MPLVIFIVLVAVIGLVYVLASRAGSPLSIPWINAGGRQGADTTALRGIEDDVIDAAGNRPPKDLAP
jgi:hypothetical protein